MARIVRRHTPAVSQFLKSSDMQRVMGRIADEMALQIRTSSSRTYPRLPEPVVTTSPNGGRKRDRATGIVTVPAPPAEDVRYPDVKGRFSVVQSAISRITRGGR